MGNFQFIIITWKWKWQLLSYGWLFVTPWTVAHQVPLSMEFSRREYWSGLPFPFPGDLPHPGTEPRSPVFQADSLSFEPPRMSLLSPRWPLIITLLCLLLSLVISVTCTLLSFLLPTWLPLFSLLFQITFFLCLTKVSVLQDFLTNIVYSLSQGNIINSHMFKNHVCAAVLHIYIYSSDHSQTADTCN